MSYKVPNIFDLALLEKGIRPVLEDLDVTEMDDDTEDYTELEDDIIEDETSENISNEQESNDSEVDSSNEEPAEGEDEDESTDYTAMSDDSEDGETSDDTQSEEEEVETSEDEENAGIENSDGEDDGEQTKSYFLLKDYLSLYKIVKDGIKSVSSVSSYDVQKSSVFKKVEENLIILRDYIYMYLSHDYDKNNYIQNLTNYNYFSSSLSLIINMVKEWNDYETIMGD